MVVTNGRRSSSTEVIARMNLAKKELAEQTGSPRVPSDDV
jgi:hypothetical protein